MPHWFKEQEVQADLIAYQDGGCTDVELRNKIMSHFPYMCSQAVRAQQLYKLWGFRNYRAADQIMDDILSACYLKVESLLWKWDRTRGTKVFSFWNGIIFNYCQHTANMSRRDQRYAAKLTARLLRKALNGNRNEKLVRFRRELSEIKPPTDPVLLAMHEAAVEALSTVEPDDVYGKGENGLISALRDKSGCSRDEAIAYLTWLRGNADKFTLHEVDPSEIHMPITRTSPEGSRPSDDATSF